MTWIMKKSRIFHYFLKIGDSEKLAIFYTIFLAIPRIQGGNLRHPNTLGTVIVSRCYAPTKPTYRFGGCWGCGVGCVKAGRHWRRVTVDE